MDAQSALNVITDRNTERNPMSVNELRALANSVDANTANSTLLLWSGGVGKDINSSGEKEFKAEKIAESLSNDNSVKTMADTQIGKFLESDNFQTALQNAADREGMDFNALYSGTNENYARVNATSFWDTASARIVDGHTGDFRLIMPSAPIGSVAAETEIPALLNKASLSGQKVNGVDLKDWQDRYQVDKLLSGESTAKTELIKLISSTSKADLADMRIGTDATGKLHVDTNSYLGKNLGLPARDIPAGAEVTRLASLESLRLSYSDMAQYVKYQGLLNKAGVIGDVLGTALAVSQAQQAYNSGKPTEAGAILAAHAGSLAGGISVGYSASLAAGLLLVPGLNVGIGTGMVIAGAAGLAGGYFGGLAGEKLFKDLYHSVSSLDMALLFQNLKNDFGWAFNQLGQLLMQNIGELSEILNTVNSFFLQFKNWTPPRTDPLVLDLDNDGIETIGINNPVILFDHDGDGIKTGTGWVKSDDGLLVLDRNANGTIDKGAELFGVDTIKSNGNRATNGFDALSDLDSNSDQLFDQNDSEFAHVQVWRDLNQNGVSTSNELFSLSQLGIVSIELNATSQNVNLGNGNVQTASAAHLTVDGTGKTGNLDLANNPFYREFIDSIPLTEQAQSLPDTQGSGWVRDLRQAVSLSPALASALTNFVSQTSYTDQKAQLDEVLNAWANTSAMKTSIMQASDHGYFLIYLNPNQSWSEHDIHLGYWNTTDANILDALSPSTRTAYEALQQQQQELTGIISVLERFNGAPFVTVDATRVTLGDGFQSTVSIVPGSNNPSTERVYVSLSTQQMEMMQQGYETLKESVYGSLVLQTRLAPYLNEITLDANGSGQVLVNFSTLNTLLDNQKIANPATALADLIELNKYAGQILRGNSWTGLDMLRSWIDQGVGGAQTLTILQDLGVSIVERGTSPDDIIFSSAGNTNLSGSGGNDVLNGGVGNDTLYGNSGNDILYGGSNRDLLMGGDGNDVLRGGGGNDHLSGDNGNDKYLYGIGDGNISINNSDTLLSNQDVLGFMAGINPADVIVRRDSSNLLLTIKSTGKVVNITHHFYEEGSSIYALDAIEFSDGMLWNRAVIKQMAIQSTSDNDNIIGFASDETVDGLAGDDILSGAGGNDHLNGNIGNDRLYGNDGNDTLLGGDSQDELYGGTGNDILNGGLGANDFMEGDEGNDIYLFAARDGNTTINNFDITAGRYDVLRFASGINPSDVLVGLSGYYDLQLTLQSTGEVITLQNHFVSNGIFLLNAVEFADGTIWSSADLVSEVLTGTSGADDITGFSSDDTINGLGGNDKLDGAEGNDTLLGGDGQDFLLGDAGNDILNGGLGANDYLRGDEGNDIYLFAVGDGNTQIDNTNYDPNEYHDVLRFASGINPSDVLVRRSDYNLLLTIKGTGEVVTVQSYFYRPEYLLHEIEFADGTTWDIALIDQMLIQGSTGNDNLTGYASDDIIDGLEGDDTLSGAGGNDHLSGNIGNDRLTGGDGNDTLLGGDGQDLLYGNAGNDTLNGGLGAYAVMEGGEGNDIYLFAVGDGNTRINNYDTSASRYDVLRFASGISPSDILAKRAGNLLLLTIQSTGEVVTVENHFYSNNHSLLNAVEFADGTNWSSALISQLVLQGTPSNDNIWGFASDDIIDGLDGDDTLSGASGNDHLSGNTGKDTLEGGDGNDTLLGGEGQDSLRGDAGNDTLNGGLGANDYMQGGEGNDVYLFAAGDGNTSIENYDASVGHYDVLRFASGIIPSDVLVGHLGDNLLLTIQSTSEVVTVRSHFSGGNEYPLNAVEFADGTTWNSALIKQMVMQATTGNDNIRGFSSDDTIDGLSGDDILSGVEGNDHLSGNIGNDRLYGENGNDTLIGGEGQDFLRGAAGNDILNGGLGADDFMVGDEGNDIYLFAAGDGNTTISNYDISIGRYDVLRFASGINPSDVLATRRVDNLRLTLQSTGEVITVQDHFRIDFIYPDQYILNAVEFSDGTTWNSALISQLVMQTTTGNDNITGYAYDDTIDGLSGDDFLSGAGGNDHLSGNIGNDVLYGGYGNDILLGGDGQDSLYGGGGDDTLDGGLGASNYMEGGQGNDIYLFAAGDGNTTINNLDTSDRYDVLRFASGISFSDVLVRRSGNDLQLTLQSNGEALTVQNHFLGGNEFLLNAVEFADGTIWNSATLTQKLLTGTAGADTITGFTKNDTINGLGGNDTLSGGGGNDTLYGGDGDDTLNGGTGTDWLFGELGNDTYSVDNVGDSVTESVNAGNDKINSNVIYTISANVESLTLTGKLAIDGTGNDLNNTIVGNSAANQLSGGVGDDTLDGSLGNDILTGGAGKDDFKLTTARNIDTITDFVVADDTIRLENAVFTKLTATGTLAASRFKIGTQATDADDYIIYNSATGALYYDSTGSAAGAAVQIATMGIGLNLTNADFVVI